MNNKANNKDNNQITTQCWLTGQFLFYFEQQKRQSGSELYKAFLLSLNTNPKINDLNFVNQGVLLMLCYGLMVYPLEYWKSILDNDVYFQKINKYVVEAAENHPEGKININNISELFEINKDTNARDLLRHLRNSISHARIEVDLALNRFIFQDIDRDGTQVNFLAKITIKNLAIFLTGVGKYFCNQ